MNEVNQIHLGRQTYTISVAAYKDLKNYLEAIEAKVGDKDVVDEVELRISELLAERGVTDEKVILPADIKYIEEQLGNPADFGDDEETVAEKKADKRLFRDTDNAMVAGVAAGLANYFGIDAVIVRLIFVLLAFFGSGLGIVLYVVLWLVVQPAETASEKLQMRGRPVTLEALKESVDKADVAGAARRVNSRVLPIINTILRVVLRLIGLGFILAGLGMLIGVSFVKMYMLLHHGQLFQENLFPVGTREQWLFGLVMISTAIVAIFLMLTGISTFKRKWPIYGWITGILAGLFIIATVGTAALAADAAPRIRDRYEASLHTTPIKNIQPFTNVTTNGDIDISYISSPNYAVNVRYEGNPDLSKLKITENNGTLYIDSSALDAFKHCTMLCLFPRYNMTVEVYAPNVKQFVTPPNTDIFYPATPAAPVAP